jgi:hypothetical protein
MSCFTGIIPYMIIKQSAAVAAREGKRERRETREGKKIEGNEIRE